VIDEDQQLDRLLGALSRGLRVPPKLLVSEWAARYRQLSSEASAERGQWRNRPFQAEPMDCLSPTHLCERVVLMCASQLMKTEILVNFVGYIIDQDPGPILFVEPREEDAKTLSKDRIAPMLRDTPQLAGKVADVRSRDAKNTTLHKGFQGGHLTFVGAISPAALAMRPIRYCLLDEVDRYPVSAGTEGDPVMLAVRRTDEFAYNKKIIEASTPTIEGASRIARAYEASDQRKPYVPCPFCGEFQVLQFAGLEWPSGKPDEAQYRCGACRELIPHHKKTWMLESGKWIAHNPGSKVPGFWISQLYSTRRSWGAIAEEFLEAIKTQETLKVFTNTVLAETWKEKGEAPEWKRLHDRREPYPLGFVPERGLLLTAGVDVQKDRLEGRVYAWGRNFENWVVDSYVLTGDTSREEVWHLLREKLNLSYPHESGAQMSLVSMAVDSGYETQAVYRWARRTADSRVMVVRGSSIPSSVPLSTPRPVDVNMNGRKIKRGLKLYIVGTGHYKSELYGWLRQERPAEDEGFPVGFSHFSEQLDEEFFRQLTAEELVTRVNKNRYRIHEWVKTRERNEALDTAVYARAAAAKIGIDRYTERNWLAVEQTLRPEEIREPDQTPTETPTPAPMVVPVANVTPTPPAPAPRPRPVTGRSNWMRR
jgi:phage terminase large subunit GpA-like protein